MTQGFYEQLGVDPAASTEEIRTAYARAVSTLVRRRKALVQQGGDAGKLDLHRAQLDEAFAVLADEARRRRYDAMLAFADTPPDQLWDKVAGALVHPSAAAAAELLRVATNLKVGVLPPAPGQPRRNGAQRGPQSTPVAQPRPQPVQAVIAPEDEVTVTATSPTAVPRPEEEYAAPVVPLPTARPTVVPSAGLRVVDGSPDASSVIVLPSSAPRRRSLTPQEIGALVDTHGYTGALMRAVREAREIPLDEMSDTTRISVRYLEAIEGDAFDVLPSATFVRGYVREMARMLVLDEEALVQGYMRRFER